MEIWECTECMWYGPVSEIRKEELFAETRTDPAEWEWYCPGCNKTTLQEFSGELCDSCGREPVPDEGEQCQECMTCHAEDMADAARGH
jgi:hypothetical protein